MWDILKRPEIPLSLRICAGTDGSVTLLLELLTGKKVTVETKQQYVVKATQSIAKLLGIEEGDDVNTRLVTLNAGDMVYVLARSLSPIKRMPPEVRDDLMLAKIPIGRILRSHKLETRRDIIGMKILKKDFFGDIPVLSREYTIIYKNNILMWINECFPIDDRWRFL